MHHATVLLVIVLYFALLAATGALAARRAAGRTAGFYNGGRTTPWPLVAIATLGAAISGVTFISVPGMVAAKGWSYLQMALGFVVGYAVIAWVLVPVFYRHGVLSIYEYLDRRFGVLTHRAGAWLFFISKLLGASVRFFVVCIVLQTLLFAPLHIPFEINVVVSTALIWLYTRRGGVASVVWADILKSLCLVGSVVLCIVFIARHLDLGATSLLPAVLGHHTSRILYLDDPFSALYFWKQFIAGVFMAIATNGLDQDMMQRNLACRTSAASRKNLVAGGLLQLVVIALFLLLGTLLVMMVEHTPSMTLPADSDALFPMVVTHPALPGLLGPIFLVGLVAAAYSAAGSALTSLTTSLHLDILRRPGTDRPRPALHILTGTLMAAVIIVFAALHSQDAISAVYTLASYTYGPILGLFAFGLLTRRGVRDGAVPWVCLAAPLVSWGIQGALHMWTSYRLGFELLLLNALLTILGLLIFKPSSHGA